MFQAASFYTGFYIPTTVNYYVANTLENMHNNTLIIALPIYKKLIVNYATRPGTISDNYVIICSGC